MGGKKIKSVLKRITRATPASVQPFRNMFLLSYFHPQNTGAHMASCPGTQTPLLFLVEHSDFVK